jgi:NAD(P)-dependent dehydrogenase (short-subunit alcohol dehydrogenase family)
MSTQKTWFITGASKGFGFEIAAGVLAAGDKVVATVRNQPAQLIGALNNHPDLLVVVMDVSDETLVRKAVDQAIGQFGRIDVLVNNAGYGLLSGVEEASDAEVRKQYDTNVFGVLNVTRAVLPYMRRQASGHVINISSLFGFGSIPGWGVYGSTKFAIEGITEALAIEVKPLGIHVTAVEPGLFRTNFLDAGSFFASSNVIDAYKDTVGPMRSGAGQLDGKQPGDPKKLAHALLKLVNSENPPVHLPLGKDALALYRDKTARLEKELAEWKDTIVSTDFEQ